jgi:hypothetical protein
LGKIKNPYPLKAEQKAIMKIIAGDSSIGSIVKAH